ncbi:Gfo/Idh/MocA family protein [Tautonia plasticadhaerens]|uniref:Putative oxidoreductase YcjS n=1 Tax=Tautonia plasticadhaerens TaxID=2527974 RepID=A0A518GXI7_9BACT|nr:Gfo/Idh/MocA family oxidoreductase [Tautonia plasticadhaerens]QDV33308.1 putative oxidoreductase YcjS [Tautonia plasticadhaerens]
MTALKIGIVGCGHAARIHSGRLRGLDGVSIVACADPDPEAARALARELAGPGGDPACVAIFADHQHLLAEAAPDVLAIFTPPRSHYRPAMDGLQAGCHLFIEKPLSTNAQEADDIVSLARGRDRVVGVGHQFRLAPSLVEARRRLADGAIGRLRLVSAIMADSWLAGHGGPENAWRLDPRISGGGILADAGDHLLDALIWTTGRPVAEVVAFQEREAPGLDVVDAVCLRLSGGIPATLAISGVAPGPLFEITYFGESGTLRASDSSLQLSGSGAEARFEEIPPTGSPTSIDADFIDAIRSGRPPCCSAEQAMETVRLQEAIARSAGSGQVIRLAQSDASG